MAKLKTQQNDADVQQFINSFAPTEQKRKDAFELLDLMQKWTCFRPKMWGSSMIGYGSYYYKSVRSRQEGEWFLVGFSPRKAAISLYVYSGGEQQKELLGKLGKFRMGKACIYVNKLSDINLEVLQKLVVSTVSFLQEKHGTN